MVLSTRSSTAYIVSLDVGSYSVRALLFDSEARQVEGYGARLPHPPAAEIDPETLANQAIDCLDELHRQVHQDGMRISAVAASSFWHSLMGVDENGRATTPLLGVLDTHASAEAAEVPNAHARTGCVPHSSYWPAKLLWLRKTRPAQFDATRRWLSFPEFLFEKLHGRPGASLSMVSATGLWDQNLNDYDAETLSAVHVDRKSLPDPAHFDEPACQLLPDFRPLWPAFLDVPWFPALGDGACDNIGSGCLANGRFALMVGTTGALRAVVKSPSLEIDPGLWCYRLDRDCFVTGGALSNGGEVYAWMKRTLALPKDIEARLESLAPGASGLSILPYFAGERSPYWRSDLHAAIAGLSFQTEPVHILHAALESVALRFRVIYEILAARCGASAEVIASGGALLHSPTWTQMMADALGRPVTACTEPEASARGAALWALNRTGAIPDLSALPASLGATFTPRPERAAAYQQMLAAQHDLFHKLYES
jgi:gluconokinase